ncbi:MBL fold metallo-hydrolase [Variovorax terrae]|uniref:MBL fold metallo-hydrolase n=1 Tax=Variovorax terrae TaxID=2923278 RepID=A0A9X1VXT8_9BURK|nr:MBL fold metallo-hydrolase [Variovorax terrae]MCJ0764910.1 MBL fold metallo-hydrolase [Variovorax terrae]
MTIRRRLLLTVPLGALLQSCASPPSSVPAAQDAAGLLRQSDLATGASKVESLAFVATGSGGSVGQAFAPGQAWPMMNYSRLARRMDYGKGAIAEDYIRTRAEPTGGGMLPLMGQGESRATSFAVGDYAWNAGPNNSAMPSPAALEGRLLDLWTSPHGVLHAAQRWGARAGSAQDNGQAFATLSFTIPGRLEAMAWIDAQGLVARVDARMPHPVLGDTEVVTRYLYWSDVGGGVKFPMRIRQTQGGFDALDVSVHSVELNPLMQLTVPENVRQFRERVHAEQVANGVWFLTEGSHNSVLIEMSDHLMLVESPVNDGRALAVLAEAHRLAPGKPVRYVVNTHHHFDHAGGLRAAAAEGATLVTSALAKPYYERIFSNSNRIQPDSLTQSGKTATLVGVNGRQVFSDGQRSVEVHEIQDSVHSSGLLIVYLPAERLLVEADSYTPGLYTNPAPGLVNANNQNLADAIDRLGLKVDRILPLHGRISSMAEFLGTLGRRPQ